MKRAVAHDSANATPCMLDSSLRCQVDIGQIIGELATSAGVTAHEPTLQEAALQEATDIVIEAERLQQAAMSVRSRPRNACWRAGAADAMGAEAAGRTRMWEDVPGDSVILERAVDQVLKEGQALEEKDFMYLQMRREGQHSATRRVIAANVKSRMRGAMSSNGKKTADVHVQATRIRKNLTEMKSSRKEMRSVRKNAEAELFPAEPEEPPRHFDPLRARFYECAL